MRGLLLTGIIIMMAGSAYAQSAPAFNQLKLKTPKDYKAAEPIVLQADDYVLASPINKDTAAKSAVAAFLMSWMEGTPRYTFVIDENTTKSFLQNTGLVEVYIASMSKFAIETKAANSRDIILNAIKNLLAYVNDPANNVVQTDELKALSEANDKGELENFLNL